MDKQQIDHMVSDKAKAAKSGMRILSLVSSEVRNNALQAMASAIRDNRGAILAANKIDMKNGLADCLADPLMKRLELDDKKIEIMADNLVQVAALPNLLVRLIACGIAQMGSGLELFGFPLV